MRNRKEEWIRGKREKRNAQFNALTAANRDFISCGTSLDSSIGLKLRNISQLSFGMSDYSSDEDSVCLTFGSSIPAPVTDFEQIEWFPSFRKQLRRLNFQKPLPIQRTLWPAVARYQSVCCVAGPNSGKTYSYLIPVMNCAMKTSTIKNRREIRAIILCSSLKKVNKVFREAHRLKGAMEPIKISDVNILSEDRVKRTDILISTPAPLLRLLKANIVSLSSCRSLVLDDGDRCLELHMEAVKEIFSLYIQEWRRRWSANFKSMFSAQTLIFGEKWTQNLRKFHETQFESFVVFGSYFEAVIASKIRFSVEFVTNDSKRKDMLLTFVNSAKVRKVESIAVLCCNNIEAKEVFEVLTDTEFIPIVVDETTEHFDTTKLCKKNLVLVITDENVVSIKNIHSIVCVIHYNVSLALTMFNRRFVLLSNRLSIESESSCESHVILSPSNELQAYQFYNFLRRCDLPIPPEVNALRKSVPRALCSYYLSFGNCRLKSHFCFLRHSFNEDEMLDKSLPVDGQIKGIVTCVLSANEFYMQINEHRNGSNVDAKWCPLKKIMSFKQLVEKLEKLKSADLGLVKIPEVDELYAVYVLGSIKRVLVTDILERQRDDVYMEYSVVKVFYVDFGENSQCPSFNLIPLPFELKRVPYFAHKFYLWGIKPVDNEIEFQEDSMRFMKDTLLDPKVAFVTTWILLQVEGIFWVNEIRTLTKIESLETAVSFNPVNAIVEQKLADKNELSLPNFNTNRGLVLMKWTSEVQRTISQNAFLEDQYSQVFLTHFNSCDDFYVKHCKFVSCLLDLEKDLSNCEFKDKQIEDFVVGLICVCYHEHYKAYNRCRVEKVTDGDTVDVFFLDYGETNTLRKDCCFRIEKKFITRLPFQAIRCKLVGVEGNVDQNVVYDLTRFKNEDLKYLIAEKVKRDDSVTVVRLYVEGKQTETLHSYDLVSKWLSDHGYITLMDEELKVDQVLKMDTDDGDHSDEETNSRELDPKLYELAKMFLGEEERKGTKKVNRAAKLKRTLKRLSEAKSETDNSESDERESSPKHISSAPLVPESFSYEVNNTDTLPYDPCDLESNYDSEEEDLEEEECKYAFS